jgi:REP element-mobilizing transposase RayT
MVFVLKYRKQMLLEVVPLEYFKNLLYEICNGYYFKFDAIGIEKDHFHIVVCAAPRCPK